MTGDVMNRVERETLIKIARQRERVAKSEAKERAAHLLADFEAQMDRRYSFNENEVWDRAYEAAQEAEKVAEKAIADECERLGIPEQFRPTISLGWMERGRNTFKAERVEMRRVALRQIESAQKSAIVAIERQSVQVQEAIMVSTLTSDSAREMLAGMPTTETLMPTLTIDSIAGLISSEKGRT